MFEGNPRSYVLRLKSTEPPEVVIPEKTGCGSVCKQKRFLLWFDSRGGTESYQIYGKRKIMWADELGFGAFIAIWPVTLMINAAEWASFWAWAHAECVCLTKTVVVAMKSPSSFVSDCVLSPLPWELPAVIWKGFLCRRHNDAFWRLLPDFWKQTLQTLAPRSARAAGLQQVLDV